MLFYSGFAKLGIFFSIEVLLSYDIEDSQFKMPVQM